MITCLAYFCGLVAGFAFGVWCQCDISGNTHGWILLTVSIVALFAGTCLCQKSS